MTTQTPTTPAALIASGGMSSFQKRVVLLCLIVGFIDGFDALTIGYVVPTIAEDWGLNPGELTSLVTAGALGLMLGAVTFGSVGDKRGRRLVIISGLAAFGLFTSAMVFAPNLEVLTILRFFAGLGLGAVTPALIALAVEFVPTHRKSVTTAAIVMMIGAGGFIGGILSSFILPAFGWRPFFAIGGIAPLLFVPVLLRLLPESVEFLASQNRIAEVRAILTKINPSFAHREISTPPSEQPGKKTSVRTLFVKHRALLTVLLWTGFFCQLLMLFVLTSWMPTLLRGAGMTGTQAILATSLLTLGQMLGALGLGRVIDHRKQDFRLVAVGFPIGAVAMVCLVFSLPNPLLVMPLAFLVGLFALATGAGMTALAANLYPPASRATGIAWGLTAGRVGAFLGPLGVGLLLQANMSPTNIFLVAVIPALVAAIVVLYLVRKAHDEIRRQSGLAAIAVESDNIGAGTTQTAAPEPGR